MKFSIGLIRRRLNIKNEREYAAIILAAGESKRMGEPKLLLEIGGKPLIINALELATSSVAQEVFVVTGSNSAQLKTQITNWQDGLLSSKVSIIYNQDWQEGIASSIRTGILHAQEFDVVLIMLADQPELTIGHLDAIFTGARNSPCGMSATFFVNTIGPPCAFRQEHYDHLFALRGDSGAKQYLVSHYDEVTKVQTGNLWLDIDTPQDFTKFKK